MRRARPVRAAIPRVLAALLLALVSVPVPWGSAAPAFGGQGRPSAAGVPGRPSAVGVPEIASPAKGHARVAVAALPGRSSEVRKRLVAAGASIVATLPWGGFLVEPADGGDAPGLARKGRGLPGVRYAEPTARVSIAAAVPNDANLPQQWHHTPLGTFNAWDLGRGAGVRIAVVDTGVNYANVDLSAPGKYLGGYDYVNLDADPLDDHWHGTWVATLAAATADNAQYGAGIAPAASIVAFKVLDRWGSGDAGDVALAMAAAVDTWGCRVINLSLATADLSQSLVMRDAAAYAHAKGAVVIAAVGNIGSAGVGATTPAYPAAFDHVIGVGGTNEVGDRWSDSPQGARADGSPVVTVSAPASNLYSLRNSTWGAASGTSGSSALVSGTAADILSRYPWASPDQVEALLKSTAVDVPPAGVDVGTGYGGVRTEVAMQATPADAFEPDDTPAQAVGSAARRLVEGGAFVHSVAPTSDVDVQYADLAAGRTYRFWTSDLAWGADTSLALLGTDGTSVIAACDDVAPGQPYSEIVWTCDVAGRYYLRNTDPRGSFGEYRLNVRDVTAANHVVRLGGADRYDAAARIAAEGFPGWAGVTDVVVVCGEDRAMADPLSAAGLCGVYRAPLLLTRSRGLNNQTRGAIAAMPGRVRVHIVGGPASVTPYVEGLLRKIPNVASVDRITGLDRYELAANVARRIRSVRLSRGEAPPRVALVANGQNMGTFFDALALSSVSASKGYPLLLVKSTALPPATLKVKRELGIGEVYVGGSPTNVNNGVYSAIGGTTRWWGPTAWDTALAVAQGAVGRGFVDGTRVGVAAKLPDALTGAATFGQQGGVMMPVPSSGLTAQAATFMRDRRASMWAAYAYGGPASVSETTLEQMRSTLR